MVIFGRTRGPIGGAVFGEKGPVIPFLLRDREAGKVEINTGLIKVIVGLNKVREEVKTLWEIISFFTRSF